uniref:Cubilin n=3 Tax=Cacopsylla melanoneura TaxID=428564 RepID=A0A8D8LJ60_9HEMI
MAQANWHTSARTSLGLSLQLLVLLVFTQQSNSECDRKFVSLAGGPLNGTFVAPTIILPVNQSISFQCVYTFIAGPGQRVEVEFDTFNLRGTPPECNHEYLDVYEEVRSPDPASLINSPFGGRYCGPISPRTRISLFRVVAISFYTDKNVTGPAQFTGRYTFVNDSEYQVGTSAPDTACSFVVHSKVKRQGTIISPTYPGTYPKSLNCSYLFYGAEGQRVRLEFRDFDLFFGGPHCPFDVVKVFDGDNTSSPVIGTYCGQQRNLVLYSSESKLLVTFGTLQRTANTQNRGFKGIFEFSESFVKLEFIEKSGEHIRGTECDQKILSKKESTGFVYSPNYPFPYLPKIVCRYFIYGMQDSQNLERVKLEFKKFDIPKGEKGDCSDGFLKLYLKGQEATDNYEKFDHEMCGQEEKSPIVMVSDGPRLVLVFSSGELQGGGFKAKYSFETEYKVPGTAAPDGACNFTYRSSSKKKGEFNSPRYPSNYPSNLTCTYNFLATPNEQVTIIFDQFKIRADSANTSYAQMGVSSCHEDWLEMYNLYKDGTEKLIGRYCGMTTPGPMESNRGAIGVRILLHTDALGVYSGFKARYSFDVAKSIFGDCGGNVSSSNNGEILSPNFPLNYDSPSRGMPSKTCNWYINVRPNYKIMLNFEIFSFEGDPAGRGCSAAVVRVWNTKDDPPLELCGEKGSKDKWEFLSESNEMRLSFISAEKSVGAQGFKATWTEISLPKNPCNEFRCSKSKYCIPKKLQCNKRANCGADDDSDEKNCVVEVPLDIWFCSLMASLAASVVLTMVLCVWCMRRRSRNRRHHSRHLARLHASPGSLRSLAGQQHVCDELGQRFASVDSV